MILATRFVAGFLAVAVLIPSLVFGLLFGIHGLVGTITARLDPDGGVREGMSYFFMLVGAVGGVTTVLRRRRAGMAFSFAVLALAWWGASWNRHSDDFLEWMLVPMLSSAVVAFTSAWDAAGDPRGSERETLRRR